VGLADRDYMRPQPAKKHGAFLPNLVGVLLLAAIIAALLVLAPATNTRIEIRPSIPGMGEEKPPARPRPVAPPAPMV
jgi:hypothetical protein